MIIVFQNQDLRLKKNEKQKNTIISFWSSWENFQLKLTKTIYPKRAIVWQKVLTTINAELGNRKSK